MPTNHHAPRLIDELDVEALPPGARTRLLVEVAHDATGQAVRVPVLVARGRRPGPVFGITAALHGNELNGIPVIHRLVEELNLSSLHGTVVGVTVANVPAYLIHDRRFPDGTDLNHIMPGRPDGNDPEVYAHRLVQRLVRHFDYLIDLHTASFGRVNSLYVRADMTHPVTARMAQLQRPEIILHNPPSDHTLRGTAMDLGIPAITVEVGDPQVFQPRHIRPTLAGIRRVLVDVGMTPRRPVQPGVAPVLCRRSYWLYTDHGGLLRVLPNITDQVEEGEVIARLRNAFGDVVQEYRAPEPGIVIGRSVNPAAQTGARILHLGVLAEEGELPHLGERSISEMQRVDKESISSRT